MSRKRHIYDLQIACLAHRKSNILKFIHYAHQQESRIRFMLLGIYFTLVHLIFELKCGVRQLSSRCKIIPIVNIAECFGTKNTVFLRQKHFVSIIETRRFYDENPTNLIANKRSYSKLGLFFICHSPICCDYLSKSSFSSSDS